MTLEELIAYRDLLYAEYDRAQNLGLRKADSLAFQIASINESIAEEYLKAGFPDSAVWSYLSQGEYLGKLGRIEESKAAWIKARDLTTNEKVKSWINIAIQESNPVNLLEK